MAPNFLFGMERTAPALAARTIGRLGSAAAVQLAVVRSLVLGASLGQESELIFVEIEY